MTLRKCDYLKEFLDSYCADWLPAPDAEYPPGYSTYDHHRVRAAHYLKKLQDREASGEPIKQNDPTYPRREAEKVAIAALYDCVELFEKLPPFEVVELVAHLLNYPADEHIFDWRRPDNYYKAVVHFAHRPQASLREVARAVGVSKETVKKWKSETHFKVFKMMFLEGWWEREEIRSKLENE